MFRSFRRLAFTKKPAPFLTRPSLRSQSSFSAGGGGGSSSGRRWFIGALALGAPPAAYYLYQQQKKREEMNIKPIVLPDLGKKYDGAIVLDGRTNSPSDPNSPVVSVEPVILKTKYLLIGGGLASFAAMESILETDDNADILMITDEPYAPYMRPPLAKELWYNFDRDENLDETFEFTDWHGEKKPIFFQDASFFDNPLEKTPAAEGRKAQLLTGRRAVSIDPKNRVVTLHDGTKIEYQKALIATGSRSKTLTAQTDPNVDGNVSTLRNISDFKNIRNAVDKAEHIAIIGGGFIGSELAASIASYSDIQRPGRPLKITQIFPEEGNLALVFPKYLSTWAMKQLRALGVKILPNSNIKMISRLTDDKVRVETSSPDGGETLDVDHVIIAIGAQPNIELALSAALPLDDSEFAWGGLKASPELELYPQTLFGAGDIISFYDPALDLRHRVEHYAHALSSGRVAGLNMATENPEDYKQYEAASVFWSDLGPAVGFEAVGLVDSSLTTIGVWAKGEQKDTPAKAQLDSADVRTKSIGQTSPSSVEPLEDRNAHLQQALLKHFNDQNYRKGIVLYVHDRRVVGMLMFNLFNRTALAKNVLAQGLTVDDLQDIVELFNINDL